MSLKRIIYLSVPRDGLSDEDVGDILKASHRNNPKVGITGILVFTGRHFLQAIEGDNKSADALISKISRDPRHSQIDIVAEGPISERLFSDWSMGYSKNREQDLSDSLELAGALSSEKVTEKLNSKSSFTTTFLRGLIKTTH